MHIYQHTLYVHTYRQTDRHTFISFIHLVDGGLLCLYGKPTFPRLKHCSSSTGWTHLESTGQRGAGFCLESFVCILLVCMSIPHCSDGCSFVVSSEIRTHEFSDFVVFRIVLSVWEPLKLYAAFFFFLCVLANFMSISCKIESSESREPQLRKMPPSNRTVGKSLEHFWD